MHRPLILVGLICAGAAHAAPVFLDQQFELPDGLKIYKAAGPELSGGSYALTFDGEGRLLVGDGTAVRRLVDEDGDGVFDRFEVVATGLGVRGPQGLLVYGDRLYAVGGDGIQLYDGYGSTGSPTPRGRIGEKFRTGGDHDSHTLFRGHDGWLYFMAGNGAGNTNRLHITEQTSPALREREASVFRVSPDGRQWECLGTGGRNPPSLGMNYLGDLFSFDSDMEWHVGLPWYRPVRLNHWALGGDQGWHDVGAYPPYYLDCLPGILEVGRGSPNWGVFYEHIQLPSKYRDAFLVCDYRWKQESNDQYATSGRLVAFLLQRQGSGWKASMETLARPRPGARDAAGRPISFALVDIAVAPDGSLFLSEHNQGIWRICSNGSSVTLPPVAPAWPEVDGKPAALLQALLELPQPASERTRLREASLRARLGNDSTELLQQAVLEPKRPLAQRLRALRLLSPQFAELSPEFIGTLARDRAPELRGQAAWLLGLRGGEVSSKPLQRLLNDKDPFVRRRAAEAFNRVASPGNVPALVDRMADPDRLVRYVAMNALAHLPTAGWFDKAVAKSDPQVRLRALAAATLRQEPPASDKVRPLVPALLEKSTASTENHLDLLRILALYRSVIEADAATRTLVTAFLVKRFPDADRNVRWEQARLLGDYQVTQAFAQLLRELESETDPVTQFHLGKSLAALSSGWTDLEEERALSWFLKTQRGWFAEFAGKGVEFPEFWSTVLAQLGAQHREGLLRHASQIDLAGLLGSTVIQLLAQPPSTGESLIQLYRTNQSQVVRVKILNALRPVRSRQVEDLLRTEHDRLDPNSPADAPLTGAILQAWAERPNESTLPFLILEGLFHENPQVVRACAVAAAQAGDRTRATLAAAPKTKRMPAREQHTDFAEDLINRMAERADLFHALERVLVTWSGRQREGFSASISLSRRPDDATRKAAIQFWQTWFEERFGRKLQLAAGQPGAARTDAELLSFLASETVKGGQAVRGARIYEMLQCQACHGGGVTPGREGRLFGPDLAGVTRRLNRNELAEAIVYPSKQVADRFKGVDVTLKDGTALTGFLTEQTADSVTLTDREQVRRIPREQIQSLSPLATSLMPESLLNRLSWDEIKDLYAFLDDMGGGTKGTGN